MNTITGCIIFHQCHVNLCMFSSQMTGLISTSVSMFTLSHGYHISHAVIRNMQPWEGTLERPIPWLNTELCSCLARRKLTSSTWELSDGWHHGKPINCTHTKKKKKSRITASPRHLNLFPLPVGVYRVSSAGMRRVCIQPRTAPCTMLLWNASGAPAVGTPWRHIGYTKPINR